MTADAPRFSDPLLTLCPRCGVTRTWPMTAPDGTFRARVCVACLVHDNDEINPKKEST